MPKQFKDTKVHTRYRTKDGIVVPGVTTVLNMLSKPALIHWAWKMGLDGIDYKKYRDKAADTGTLAHLLVQCDLTGETPDLSMYGAELIDKAENCLVSWYTWRKSVHIENPLSETQLVSEHYKYGGTADCICKLNGVPTLLDFKTGKGIYPSMLVQLAAYRHLMIENGYPCEQALILNIGRDETENFDTKYVSTDDMNDLFHNIFLPAMQIYQANKRWKVV